MKIAIFTDAYWPRVNGVTVSVDSFAQALVRLGNEVMIVCPFYPDSSTVERISDSIEKTEKQQEQQPAPIIIRVPSTSAVFLSREDRIAKFDKLFWVSRQIDAFGPDIAHVNTEFMLAEFGFFYSRLHGIPVIYTFHTLWEDYAANYLPMFPTRLLKTIAKDTIKNFLRRADRIIVPTAQIQDVVRRYKIKKRAYLLPTGIDPELFQHAPEEIADYRALLERKYPLLRNKRVLLFAGRIAREKNIDFLLAIAPRIIERHPEVVFLFVGNGPDLYDFEEESQRLGLTDCCIFTGYLNRADLALTYGVSDVFVFPSLTETQGLVTIESMLSGTPVVAIGAMGTLMVMGGDNGGFMVKNDKSEFIDRVFQLLEDDALYAQKVEEAKLHAQEWTIGALTVKLEKLYRGTIDGFTRALKNNVLYSLRLSPR
jgi:glycosyltransferase involved in cell wall biosynthesis